MRRIILTVTAAVALVLAAFTAPTAAQTRQQGLVNVNVENASVQVPVAVAANVCGVAVNVLTRAANLGDVECETEGVALAENEGGDSGQTRQRGLINVNLTDVNVQVPVAVAANICGVAVNVLAQAGNFGDVDCAAFADSGAEN
jgi:hypothetical protein